MIFWIYLILVDSCDLVPQLNRKIDSPAQTFVFLEGYTTVRHTCRRLATWWSNKVSQVAFYILAKNLIIFPIDWNILSHIIPYYILATKHSAFWLSAVVPFVVQDSWLSWTLFLGVQVSVTPGVQRSARSYETHRELKKGKPWMGSLSLVLIYLLFILYTHTYIYIIYIIYNIYIYILYI